MSSLTQVSQPLEYPRLPREISVLGIVSLTLGLMAFLLECVGLKAEMICVFGMGLAAGAAAAAVAIIALWRIRARRQCGHVMACMGIGIGCSAVVLGVALLFFIADVLRGLGGG